MATRVTSCLRVTQKAVLTSLFGANCTHTTNVTPPLSSHKFKNTLVPPYMTCECDLSPFYASMDFINGVHIMSKSDHNLHIIYNFSFARNPDFELIWSSCRHRTSDWLQQQRFSYCPEHTRFVNTICGKKMC